MSKKIDKTNIRIGIIYKRLEHIMRRIEDIEENGKGLSKRADERMDRFEQRMTDTEGFMGAIDKHHSKSELKINERMDRIDHEIRRTALLSKRIDGVVEIGLDIVQQLKAIDRGMNNMSNHLAEQFNSLYRLDERMAEHDEHINKAMNKVECFKKKGD